jgi:hypothetical protein
MTPETTPAAPARIPDLAEHQRCQAELYAALAAYQHACAGEALVSPGAFGLAIHGRVDDDCVEAVLTHSAGGEISSGTIAMGSFDMFELLADAARLLLNPIGARPVIVVPDAPAPTKAEHAPAVVTPEREPAPVDLDAIDDEGVPMPVADEPPTDDEIEAVTLQLEAIHAKDPDGVKPIIASYKAQHTIGRTPFIRSITTRERLTTLQRLIAEHTA